MDNIDSEIENLSSDDDEDYIPRPSVKPTRAGSDVLQNKDTEELYDKEDEDEVNENLETNTMTEKSAISWHRETFCAISVRWVERCSWFIIYRMIHTRR